MMKLGILKRKMIVTWKKTAACDGDVGAFDHDDASPRAEEWLLLHRQRSRAEGRTS